MLCNSCTAPRGIEHYGNWVCRPTTSLRERCEHTHEVGENADRLAQWDTRVMLRNREPVIQNDGPPCRAIQSTYLYIATDLCALFVSYCISDSACSIRVTKLRAVHVWVSSTSGCSGVAQGLLLLYRHDHVDVNFIIGRNTEHDWWQQETTSHGYVEDMELSDNTQVTGDH